MPVFTRRDNLFCVFGKAVALAVRALRRYLNAPLNYFAFNAIANRDRVKLSSEIGKKVNWTVMHGPMTGFRVNPNSSWGKADIAGMLLGQYEREVQDIILQHSKDRNYFCDLGAADGFFGVGVLASKQFKKSYCFEMDAEARALLKQTAIHNRVDDKVVVLGGGR